jgi:haloacetate dehalogenase
MALDMLEVMACLGFERFAVVGHDRGARVAYRLALDHPDRVTRLGVLDALPILTAWTRADARLALAFWPWSLLAQAEPLPERLLAADPGAVIDNALAEWGTPASTFRRRCAKPTSTPSATRRTCMRSARNTAPRQE